MPKATSDFRAARAVLSAPYPLPVVITRNAPSDSSIPIPSIDQYTSAPVPQPLGSYHGFPVFNHGWHDLPPAIPPVPYPTEEKPKRTNRTVTLKREEKREGASSEVELMSIDGPPSKELHITRRLSEVELGTGRSTFEAHPTGQYNILNAVYEAELPVSYVPPSSLAKLLQPSRSRHHRADPLASTYYPDRFARSKVGPSELKSSPLRPTLTPSSDGFDEDIDADADADGEDRIKKWFSLQIQTPDTSRPSRHKYRLKKTDKPLFIGQTNLTPFTYQASTASRWNNTKDGFASEASSIGTITRIPRNRYSKVRGETSAPRRPFGHLPRPAPNKGKERVIAQTKVIPLWTPKIAIHETPSTPRPKPANTRNMANHHLYQPLLTPQPTQTAPPYMFHHMRPFEQTFAGAFNPPYGLAELPMAYGPSGGVSNHQSSPSPYRQPYESPWAPMPMFVDPRSADAQHASWPHALNGRESIRHVQSSYNPALMPILEESTPCPSANDATAFQSVQAAFPSMTRDDRLPSAPPTRPPVILPMAKACHNFLLARRVQASKRRRLFREHIKRKAEQAKRPISPMNVDHRDPIQQPQASSSTSGIIRDVFSIAHVDQTKPRKRRREREQLSDSPRLLPPVEIIQPKYDNAERDCTEMLRKAVHGQVGVLERDSRRETWLEQERRRVARTVHEKGVQRSHRDARYFL